MRLEYEIVKRNDSNYAVCETRYMQQSINIKQLFTHNDRKKCVEFLKELKKVSRKNGHRKNTNTSR